MAIYSSHIPLDVHPELGNNALLGEAIGLTGPEPFFEWKGILLGQRYETVQRRDDLVERVREAVGGGDSEPCARWARRTSKSIGVITGGCRLRGGGDRGRRGRYLYHR